MLLCALNAISWKRYNTESSQHKSGTRGILTQYYNFVLDQLYDHEDFQEDIPRLADLKNQFEKMICKLDTSTTYHDNKKGKVESDWF